MKFSKSGFTLIEVLISVIILSVIATYLFQMSINSKTNYKKLNSKKKWENLSSTIIQKDKTSSNLYEQLRADYNISNFDVRNSLKQIKLKIDISPFSKVMLSEDLNIFINIQKKHIYDSKNNTNLFSISIGN